MNTKSSSHPSSPASSDPRLGQTWALPGDATCSGVARSLTSAALARRALPIERIRDAELMMSELATNAHEHARGHPPPELWIYPVQERELICAVFDTGPEIRFPATPQPAPPFTSAPSAAAPSAAAGSAVAGSAAARADFGRGLTLVHELSGGRWGTHRSRSRLNGSIPGKVVWFGVALPHAGAHQAPGPPGTCTGAANGPAGGPGPWSGSGLGSGTASGTASTASATAAQALKELLVGRGAGPVYLSHRDGLWVVAVRYGLTVWIRDGRFELPGCTAPVRTPLSELAVVVEHLVRRYEQHRLADS